MSDKLSPLDEVRADAKFNYLSRLEDAKRKAAYEEAKQKGRPLEEVLPEPKPEAPTKEKGK